MSAAARPWRHKAVYGVLILTIADGVYNQISMDIAHTRQITLPNTRWVAKLWIEDNLPKGASIAMDHYTPPVDKTKFRVKNLPFIGLIRTSNLDTYDYLIASSGDYGRFLYDPNRYPDEARRYKEIFRKYKLIKVFRSADKTLSGPIISIYKTK